MTKKYKNKTLKVTFSDKLTVNYDVWRVPFNLDELNDENGFTYSFAYSLVAAFTFDEVAGENSLSEELKALANILIIYERKGLRELLFELVLKDEGYQDLETFYEYYRWVLHGGEKPSHKEPFQGTEQGRSVGHSLYILLIIY